ISSAIDSSTKLICFSRIFYSPATTSVALPTPTCAAVGARSRGSARGRCVAAPNGGAAPRACSPATASLPLCADRRAFPLLCAGSAEGANAKASKDGLDLVHDPRLVSDQVPSLAVRPLCVFLLGRRDRHHAAMALLAAQPAEKGSHQQFRVEAIGLRPPMFARHRDARGVDHVSLDIAGR